RRGALVAQERDGPAALAIREPPPDGDEEELHERVGGARQGRDEVTGAEIARQPRQERDHEAEAQQIEEDGEEERSEGGGLQGAHLTGAVTPRSSRRHQAPVARSSAGG